jgi:lysophospholipase L1-like esterase
MPHRANVLISLILLAVACSPASGTEPSSAVPGTPPDAATSGCPAAGELAPPRTLILFRDDGCIPASELFGFQCTPDDPPVIEIRAAGVTERFVGGRFALPMASLPIGAAPVGEGASMQVFTVADDPTLLYVGAGDGVTRWLRLPRRRVADPPTAYVIGDSIADGSSPFITEALAGWSIGFDTLIGRGTSSALTTAAAQGLERPDVVVVELGTNDPDPVAFRENAVAIMESLRRVPLVVWQTAHGPLVNIPGVNIHIRGLMPEYPNTMIADWDLFVNDEELITDGVHPAPDHQDLMARLVAPILTRWLEVASGGGAASCGAQAEVAAGVA